MFDKISQTVGALFGGKPASLEEQCLKVGQDEEHRKKVLVDAFPELALGLAKQIDEILKSSDFATKSEPVHVDAVTPENVAHVSGAIAAGNCLKFPGHAR